MHYFHKSNNHALPTLFYRQPSPVSYRDRDMVADGMGATLYIPATKDNLLFRIQQTMANSVVICLEDAVADTELTSAHMNLALLMDDLAESSLVKEELPLLFIRVRNNKHLKLVLREISIAHHYICGFALPKFEASTGAEALVLIEEQGKEWDRLLFAMPILETEAVLSLKTRYHELEALTNLFHHYKDSVTNIRIGATDMAGIYGLRRTISTTVWDIALLQSLLGDLVNYFGGADGFVISSPVWEHYVSPTLSKREQIESLALQGLVREVEIDITNGLWGKTVIHPTQIAPVMGQMVISYSEYHDALQIVESDSGGVSASHCKGRMNEMKPHRRWAEKTLRRAKIYGVAKEGVTPTKIWQSLIEVSNPIPLSCKHYSNIN